MTGTLYVGTSGFSYPAWAPAFYPPGCRPADLLRLYAARLPACELNNTFYRQPTPERVAAWVAETPAGFRFAVKAQRGGSLRALAADPGGTLPWLTGPLAGFGERLGSVLFRVPATTGRDDARLAALLAAWPRTLPLTIEFEHLSWEVDEVLAPLRDAGVAFCATERENDPAPPSLHVTAPFLYVRLRRLAYAPAELSAWAARLAPFLADGRDVFAFLRHDERGEAAARASQLAAAVRAELAAS